jgi:hypothetical protein
MLDQTVLYFGCFLTFYAAIVQLILNISPLIGKNLRKNKQPLKQKMNLTFICLKRQKCSFELQSWSRTAGELTVNDDKERPFMNHSFIHTEWKLINMSVRSLSENDFVWLEFTVELKRNHDFYGKIIKELFFSFQSNLNYINII